MPRTIESILACHQAATTRQRAGKPSWALSLPLRAVMAPYSAFGDDLTAEQAVEMSHRIGVMLKGVPAAWRTPDHDNYSMDFEDLFDRFEQASVSDFTPSKEWPDSPCESLNYWLDELYDWGDRYRVWLG